MDIDEALKFVKEHHRAVIATRRRDGAPQLSPVLVNVDPDGRVELSATEKRVKVRNLRRDPNCSVCVLSDRFFGRWIQVDGTAEIMSLPEAMEPLIDYYRRLSGEHDDWPAYRQAMQEEQRVLVRVAVQRTGPARSG